jgi:hypothetical protein
MNTSWATRPLFTLPATAGRVLLVIVILAAVFLFILPVIMTLGWHLFHGNTIETRGMKLFVPLAWIAETDGARDVSMTKLPPSLLHGLRFDGLIFVSQSLLPPDKETEEVYRSFETGYWTFAGTDTVVTGPVRIGSGASEMFCMQSTNLKAPNLVSASCLVLKGKWQAQFDGQKNDLETFFQIIRNID